MPGIDYTIGMKSSGFTEGLNGALSKLSGMGGSIVGMLAPLAGITGGIGAMGVAMASIGKAANMETLQTAFIPLLGGAKQAKDRIAELADFANSTPFEMPEVAQASRVLETLTKGALSTGKGLTLVGDVASGTNTPFAEIATTIGRLYDGLQSGRPVGEAAQRLQELGVISGDTRGKMEDLQKEGKKGQEVWGVAEAALGRFSGSMALQSQTWAGKMSTFKDSISMAMAQFGAPIMDSLKPFLDSLTDKTSGLGAMAESMGQKVGAAITTIAAAFKSGEILSIIGDSLKLAFMEGVNTLWKGLVATMSAIGRLFFEGFKNCVAVFEILTTADFWKGMGNALSGVFLSSVAFLQRGLADTLDLARPLAAILGQDKNHDASVAAMRQSARVTDMMAGSKYDKAGSQLDPAMRKIEDRFYKTWQGAGESFMDSFNKTKGIMDTTGTEKSLMDSFDKIRAIKDGWAAKAKPGADPGAPLPTQASGDQASKAAGKSSTADRLAQIGGYVGASATALQAKIAEKTAHWTQRTAEGIDKLLARPLSASVF